ncbi:MAG: restriction endonuclease subunit S [Vicinamibacterales bacterium]
MNDLRRFKSYPSYKDSGVEWLGKIPAHWDVRRLKTIADVELSNVDKKTVEGQEAVRLCNYTDVYYNERITGDQEFMSATATREQVRRFSLRAGDVLITKDSESWTDIAVPAVVTEDLPDVLCGYHLALVRPKPGVVGAFLARAFSAGGPRDQFQLAANGVTRFGLGSDAIRTGLFAAPPEREQRAIAAFLDRETSRIDALIAKKKRLLELVEERRVALVVSAVTRGLDSSAPTKDSGIEEIGRVPAHWVVTSVGRQLLLQRGTDITKGQQNEGTVPVVSSGGVSSFHDRALTTGPGVVVGRKGTAGSLFYVESDFWPHDTTLWVRQFYGNSPRFIFFKLSSLDLPSFDTGTANPTLNRNLIHPLRTSWPPIDEQRKIAAFLDKEAVRTDELSRRVSGAIRQLEQLRTALISVAVTGKIDVREAVT